MSVKYAVLGLLVQRRGYGYDLVRRFGEQVGPAWRLNPGAVYVALDALEQDGFARPAQGEDGAPITRRRSARGAPRVVYEPTPAGEREFEQWMTARSPLAPLREELHLKLALSRPGNLPRLIELTLEQEDACLRRLEERVAEPGLEAVVAAPSPWPAVAGALLRDAEAAQLQATVEWLRRARETMRRMLDQPAAGAAGPG